MLTFVSDGVRNTYNWLIKKMKSRAIDFIALFNKEYVDSKRIRYITENCQEVEFKVEQIKKLVEGPKVKHKPWSLEVKHDPAVDSLKIFKVLEQEHKFVTNLENVILVRIDRLVGRWFSYHYDGRSPVFCAIDQAHKIKGVTKCNTDLVLLLLLMYVHVPIDEHGELLKDLVKNHSNNRAEMIGKLYILQEEGKLLINSRESLDWIIKISPLIEKQYISNKKFSFMEMISSGNIHGLEKRLTEDIERRVKELTDIGIAYSPTSSLKNLSIHAAIENYGLFK